MIVAPQHVADAHQVIVDHHCEVVGWKAVRFQQDPIGQLAVLELDLAADDLELQRSGGSSLLERFRKEAESMQKQLRRWFGSAMG